MALTKQRKTELVETYVDLFQKSRGMVLADYRGLPMADLSALRGKLREVNGEFHITKNTLAEIALKQAGLPAPDEFFCHALNMQRNPSSVRQVILQGDEYLQWFSG